MRRARAHTHTHTRTHAHTRTTSQTGRWRDLRSHGSSQRSLVFRGRNHLGGGIFSALARLLCRSPSFCFSALVSSGLARRDALVSLFFLISLRCTCVCVCVRARARVWVRVQVPVLCVVCSVIVLCSLVTSICSPLRSPVRTSAGALYHTARRLTQRSLCWEASTATQVRPLCSNEATQQHANPYSHHTCRMCMPSLTPAYPGRHD